MQKPIVAEQQAESLEVLIEKKRARIGVIGLGYVGLPLAVEFAGAGFAVTGFEVDPQKVAAVTSARNYIPDISDERFRALVDQKKLAATGDFARLGDCDVIIICVPTPLRKTKDPDISYIVSAVSRIRETLRPGQLVILESTTYPGTTREVLVPMLEESGLKSGVDFHVAFSPERVDPGNPKFGIKNTPKVVGGMTPDATRLAEKVYGSIVERTVVMSSCDAAEMVKLLENTFRAVNIGLVNEVALMCHRLKLDTWEVIDAAATKPFGFMPFYPGPGLGGHCIPLDPHYLSWKLKSLNFYARFIELAGEINSRMPEHVVTRVADALNDHGKAISGSKILVLGVAYKKDIGDMRESPALDVIELLHHKKARVSYHDPFVPSFTLNGAAHVNVDLTDELLAEQDCVVVTTNHTGFDMGRIVAKAKLVVDTRNATKGIGSGHVVKL